VVLLLSGRIVAASAERGYGACIDLTSLPTN
jgi:hypothetical protein